MLKLQGEKLFYNIGVGAILMSGMVPIFRFGSSIAILIQLLIAISCFCYFRKNFFNNKSIYYVALFLILSIINYGVHFPFTDNKLIGSVIEIVAAFLIISQLEFLKFKKVWLDLVTLISVYSIIIYILVQFDFIGVKPVFSREGQSYMMSYGTVFGWHVTSERLSGFYHEPGAFQIYLNFTLLLFIKDIYSFSLKRAQIYKIIVVIVALLLTQSTMGYVVFSMIMGIGFLKTKYTQSKRFVTIPLALFIVSILWLKIATSEVVKNKFEGGNANISLVTRSADNFAMIQMIRSSPLVGYGVGSRAFIQKSVNFGNATSSNGWLAFSAGFGLPWFLLFFVGSYKALAKMNLGIPIFVALCIVLLLHANENYTHFVSAYIFVLKFSNYD